MLVGVGVARLDTAPSVCTLMGARSVGAQKRCQFGATAGFRYQLAAERGDSGWGGDGAVEEQRETGRESQELKVGLEGAATSACPWVTVGSSADGWVREAACSIHSFL